MTIACYKGMVLIYSLLSPQKTAPAFAALSRLLGFLGIGPMVALATLADPTLGKQGSADFVGFKISVEKPA